MKMKPLIGFALLAIALAAGMLPSPSHGQADAEDPRLTALIEEIAKQQATIVENQTQIDAKLAVIAENVRQARLFVSRGGGASASPK